MTHSRSRSRSAAEPGGPGPCPGGAGLQPPPHRSRPPRGMEAGLPASPVAGGVRRGGPAGLCQGLVGPLGHAGGLWGCRARLLLPVPRGLFPLSLEPSLRGGRGGIGHAWVFWHSLCACLVALGWGAGC